MVSLINCLNFKIRWVENELKGVFRICMVLRVKLCNDEYGFLCQIRLRIKTAILLYIILCQHLVGLIRMNLFLSSGIVPLLIYYISC